MDYEKYLTTDLKKYYLLDFKNLLNLPNDEFWSIDNGLLNILTELNSNKSIQTLYSKKAFIGDIFYIELISYIEIAFCKDVEDHLIKILDSFKTNMLKLNIQVEIEFCEPADNDNFNENSTLNIGCIKNRDYFRINHFYIELNSLETNNHDIFWTELLKNFKSLKD